MKNANTPHAKLLSRAAMLLPLDCWSYRKLILVGELGTARVLLFLSIVIIPYSNIVWPGGGILGSGILICFGLLLAFILQRFKWERWLGYLSVGDHLGLASVLFLGVLAQVAVSTVTNPILVSDSSTYFALAERLAEGKDYIDGSGNLAFWPLGLPLYLSPFLFSLGPSTYALAAANISLYLIGASAVWIIGGRLFTPRVGILAALLFTMWPSRLLCGAVASKENLTVAMILAGTALCLGAFARNGRWAWLSAIGAGCCFGLAALAQPGLLLFVLGVPIIYRGSLRIGLWTFVGRCLVIIVSTVIFLAPWQIRNCLVFNGEFCGYATNGGSVFYRANNSLATGLWIEEGEIPITHLPELEQNRLGFDLGIKWIRENPREFLKLAVKKAIYLVGDDSHGAYVAILRGGGLTHEEALRDSSRERLWSYQIAHWLSLVFWVVVIALSGKSLRERVFSEQISDGEFLLPLIYPLLYSAVVFSVFESGSRQHMAAEGLLLILASAYILDSNKPISPLCQHEQRHRPLIIW